MLVLMRRKGEQLVIDTGNEVIEVDVLGIFGNQIRMGIAAPKHVQVDRKEIYLRKKGAEKK